MDQVKSIIKNYLSTRSIKATARQLKISKNTVREYLRRSQAYTEDIGQLLLLDDDQLKVILYGTHTPSQTDRSATLSQQQDYWIKELRRVGVTRQLLWEEYRVEHPDGYGYSQFCEYLKRGIGRKDLTLSLNHVPGQELMVDFSGKKLEWVDLSTGQVHSCEVLVAVFPHSHYAFVIALASQQLAHFVHGLNQALSFFGGLPQVLLSDNLKSYVTRADRYEPTFTQLCEQLAAHYQLDLQATRVGKPKDKASVENAVGVVYNRIYGPLRNEVFSSLAALNEGIREQLDRHNAKAYQKKEGSRQSIFQTYERPQMRDLPSDLFEIKKITRAKIQLNYHVFIGEEKNFYSVPCQYVGQQAQIIYTPKVVEVFLNSERIALHQRLEGRGSYHYQTQEQHMPKHHQEWKKSLGYDAEYFLTQAKLIGPATHWAIQLVLVSRIHQEQSYNSCKGILHLTKKYSKERLEQAALRCQKVSRVSYNMLKRILLLELDQVEEQPAQLKLPLHDNIRGPQQYQ
ncbi:MAG: IS21 family transposase [Saprospiraceae bacterium]